MGKPFRVKRDGKEIGAYKARAKGGKVVNLQTQNAELARQRARAVAKGDYSWRKEIADGVKQTLDGSGGEPELIEEIEPEDSQEVASSEAATAAPESGPEPAVAAPPSEVSSPAPQAQAPVDPVAAANETAAATAGTLGDILKDAAQTMGVDLTELTNPENLGGLHVAGQSWLTQIAAKKLTGKDIPPLEVPEKLMPIVRTLGEAWKKQLLAWNVCVVDVPPGWAILGCSAIFAVVQLAALAKDPTAAPAAPVVGVG